MAASDLTAVVAPKRQTHGWRFWAVFPGLCFSILLAGLDTSIVATALPTIVASLHSGALYVWAVNGYFLTTAAVQPIAGQLSDLFGRRMPMILSIVFFALGSGLCGGASNTAMLIAARLIQGIGGGGLFVMVDIIVADLVPLRDRQKYMSIVMGTFAIGTFIGPIIGGVIVSNISWRWVFYINLPIAGVALVLVILFLRVNSSHQGTLASRLARIDFTGNILLMSSVVAVLIPLTWGGTLYTWSSWHILVPLFIGIVGLAAFLYHQKRYAAEPTMPLRVYANSTSLLAYILTFLHGIEMSWLSFFLPVYFQVLLEASPLRSGVDLLAIVIPLMPAGIAGGITIAVTGRYKPTMVGGYALLSIGAGLLTTLDANSTTAEWVVFQVIAGAGGGLALTATLPAVQAPLAEADVAVATASWAFVRSFGSIWGAAIPAAVFNSRVDSLLHKVSDEATRDVLARGGAYEHATRVFIKSFDGNPELKRELLDIYTAGIQEVWQVLIAFTLVAVPIAVFIKEVPLRKELVTEYGLKEDEDGEKPDQSDLSVGATGRESNHEGTELKALSKRSEPSTTKL
ncbi:major facilitator superfamily protein [Diplodia corticola]|uniref:Major facilitator superfamily protein n=1 Tax=Diplodia corticola TaxID=236234 RepID=A0A1J9RHS6_9PEZI|nr:major facilitator superfamily protein [Diplodia corticola]OJD32107.1 major facilitator superfamily protein [Diplodia corticola]